jgi:hypothetical protein
MIENLLIIYGVGVLVIAFSGFKAEKSRELLIPLVWPLIAVWLVYALIKEWLNENRRHMG